MLSPEMLHLVNEEKRKDLLRELDHRGLVAAALLRPQAHHKSYRRAVGWLGAQMVRWGAKLQSFETAPLQTKFQ